MKPLDLPEEVLLNVFQYLDGKTLASCGLVCTQWYRLSDEPTLWYHIVQKVSYPPFRTNKVLLGASGREKTAQPKTNAAYWFGSVVANAERKFMTVEATAKVPEEDETEEEPQKGYIHPSVRKKFEEWTDTPPLEKSLKWLYRAKMNKIEFKECEALPNEDEATRETNEKLFIRRLRREREAARLKRLQKHIANTAQKGATAETLELSKISDTKAKPRSSSSPTKSLSTRQKARHPISHHFKSAKKLYLSISPPPSPVASRRRDSVGCSALAASSEACEPHQPAPESPRELAPSPSLVAFLDAGVIPYPSQAKVEEADDPDLRSEKAKETQTAGKLDEVEDELDHIGYHMYKETKWYVGEWLSHYSVPHGTGIFYDNGLLYVGEFFKGKFTGVGRIMWPGGATYEGQWLNGFSHGVGRKTWITGGVYDGEFRLSHEEGLGRHSWSDGGYYEGNWKRRYQHGRGIYVWPSGNRFIGKWKNASQVSGVYAWIDGRRYEGEYKNNTKHGKGRYDFHDGSYYAGDWDHGTRHGFGTMVWADKSRFTGMWENDFPTTGEANFDYKNKAAQKPFCNYFGEDMTLWEEKYIHKIRARIQDNLCVIPRENLFHSLWENGYIPPTEEDSDEELWFTELDFEDATK